MHTSAYSSVNEDREEKIPLGSFSMLLRDITLPNKQKQTIRNGFFEFALLYHLNIAVTQLTFS